MVVSTLILYVETDETVAALVKNSDFPIPQRQFLDCMYDSRNACIPGVT